jgi:gliding motility-associated-like protein
MTRNFILVFLLLFISTVVLGQCVNGPTVTLSSTSGNTCGTTPITVAGNTFGGSATKVTISENGAGSVSPTSSTVSPFSFTYTPKNGDLGKSVIITVTTNNPVGSPCVAAKATYTLSVNAIPTAPIVGTITKPTCLVPTGSVVLSGLPSTGTWTLTRTPGGVTTTGTGTSITISGLPSGTYTFTVTSSAGCTSSSSSSVVIPAQPASPASPTQTVDCSLGSGKAVVKITSPLGTGLTYNIDGGTFQSGTSFSNVADGNHSITVKNSSGCTTTGASFQVACGCINPPTLTLNRSSGNTCGTTPVTVSGNTFGGSATNVTITKNGAGTLSPITSNITPFAFTYTPAAGDAGNTVIVTVTTNNPLGSPCAAAIGIFTLTVVANPSAPSVGVITQPSCSTSTGSVELNGLPSTGTWTLTRSPGGVTAIGSGTSTTILNLSQGTYTYTVTNSAGCVSASSDDIIIATQPSIPAAPIVGAITAPTCSLSTGSVVMTGLPETGNWILTRYPGTVTSGGTGTNITLSGLTAGSYNYTVTNSAGCVSGLSANVIIPPQPETPSPPLIGTITQPNSDLTTGSVVLNGLPENGSWTLTLTPGNITTTGSGTTYTISGLATGTYSFTVTNSEGCTSGSSASFGIYSSTGPPEIVITNPAPVCFPSTVDLTNPIIIAGSTLNLIYTYWTDVNATISFSTPSVANEGTYYIKGTTSDGFFTVKPVTVTVYKIPVANAGPDQSLSNLFETTLDSQLAHDYETGFWSLISGTGELFDSTLATTIVSGLSLGENVFLWTVTNRVCPASSDTVLINVHDKVVPTLITPNMDGKNDYFILKGSDAVGKMELIIFDRRGVLVYKNSDYDNSWNGVDYKGKPLSDDTYFYVFKIENGASSCGYIVVRR